MDTTVVKAIIPVFCDFGIPTIVQSDNGKEFVNQIMTRFKLKAGFDHRLITPYHPQGNGAAERTVGTSMKLIKKLVEGVSENWDLVVATAQLAINSKVSKRHNATPFSVMFGRKLNDFKNYNEESNETTPLTQEQIQTRMSELHNIVFPAIQEKTMQTIKKQKETFDRTHMLKEFKSTSMVRLKIHNHHRSKMDTINEGPYEVVRKTQAGTYLLKDTMGQLMTRQFQPSELIDAIDDQPNKEEIFEVEAIVAHKYDETTNKYSYKVKWVNYDQSCNTWEPADNFLSQQCIQEYWKKIKQTPMETQNKHRPDLVARVFDLKVKELLKDLKVKKVFGSYRGLVRTIEYQKRGLPHLHLLLFLDATHNIDTSTKVDHIISAEIPSKASDPELYEIITKNMVHGPCGALNPKSPCMAKNAHGLLICTKRFPKAHSEETIVTENGYPIYKRSATVNPADIYTVPDPRMAGSSRIRIPIDNGWIVPYNPFLSKKYKAHINVECCQGVQAIKYINKYIYKGSDRTTLRLSDTNDEIARHLQGRYIGPIEAFGRLFEYKVHDEDPTVTCLALHLPNEQPVYFPEDESAPQIQRILRTSTSMLIAYFKHYEENPTAEKHLYQDFPRYFVWQLKEKVWTARKRGFAIGRIPYCTPTCGERYYLRLLLVNVAGSKSFDDIKTINGHQSETFKQACLQLHLIDDDREWIRCFEKASLFSSGSSLRNLFVTALTFGQLTDPVSLWAAFRDSMCDDLDHKLNRLFPGNQLYTSTDDTAFYDGQPSHDYGLYLIETTLNELSKSLGDFNLLLFKHNWTEALNQSTGSGRTDNSLVDEQLTYDTQEEEAAYSSKYALFNLDQKHAFDRIVEKLQSHESASNVNPTHSENGICFFLHGPAGTGKTFVYNTVVLWVCKWIEVKGKGVWNPGDSLLMILGLSFDLGSYQSEFECLIHARLQFYSSHPVIFDSSFIDRSYSLYLDTTNTLCNYWRSKRKIVLCVASSGIASLLLSGGTTSHFRLKIPLKVNETSTCSITKNSKLAELLRMTTLLIWDEVPMQNKSCFETVDRTLRDIRSSNVLFGGLPVVLGGDFAQIPPVWHSEEYTPKTEHDDRKTIVK
ncbi:hypothetical protein [Absidia glauca]|uniref:ATP-dependent DNA helicase n=1 Tax=Absidia glauca TaxID=4829 RepID=A0A163JKT6_ABSGL|nr:hypothetical protein [Absidia glauca]